MGTFDVDLPADKPVVFPARCVVCEKPNPQNTIDVTILGSDTSAMNSTNTLNTIRGIPACPACAAKLRGFRRLMRITYYLFPPLAGLGFVFLPFPLVVRLVAGALCLSPIIVLPLILSPAFDATFLSDKATYEFKSQLVAQEFAALNSDGDNSDEA